MAKKYRDKDYVKEELNLTDKQLTRAEKKAKERHIITILVGKMYTGEESIVDFPLQ